MAKAKTAAKGAKRETIKPPTKKETTDASKQLKKKHSSGGRVMADKSVAVRQGAAKRSPKKKPK
jgi:hypothetical protein